MLLQADGSFRHLELHLARMAASAQALGFRFDRPAAEKALASLARSPSGPVVVRLALDAEGLMELSTRGVPVAPDGPVSLLVSPFRVDPDDPLLAHKTNRRGFHDREHRRAVAAGCFDALFLNRLDRVTEGGVTNVFARFGGTWVTPPVSDGLLPGTWRAAFLKEKAAVERSLTLDELLAADEIVAGNSVRGTLAVGALLGDPLTF
jgi:para-aminobenzoate synthetase/4-amino-4-deoxychorismate lyase